SRLLPFLLFRWWWSQVPPIRVGGTVRGSPPHRDLHQDDVLVGSRQLNRSTKGTGLHVLGLRRAAPTFGRNESRRGLHTPPCLGGAPLRIGGTRSLIVEVARVLDLDGLVGDEVRTEYEPWRQHGEALFDVVAVRADLRKAKTEAEIRQRGVQQVDTDLVLEVAVRVGIDRRAHLVEHEVDLRGQVRPLAVPLRALANLLNTLFDLPNDREDLARTDVLAAEVVGVDADRVLTRALAVNDLDRATHRLSILELHVGEAEVPESESPPVDA